MKTNFLLCSLIPCWALACSSEAGPSSARGGAEGSVAAAGSAPEPIVGGAGGSQAGASNSAGSSSSGGAGSGTGGGGSGGTAALGGASFAGAGAVAGTAGVAGAASTGGASAGAGGAGSSLDVAKGLDGVRVDDACAGTADTSVGAVCQHVTLTASGGSRFVKSATIAGTAGTTYDVTLRVRGVVEPTSVTGGTRAGTETFEYRSMTWRKVPYTVGGAVANTTDADYTQWHINVDSPKGDYYLNDYQKTGHYIFKLDYQVTIPMAANAKVTLDGTDRNERQIVNYEKYSLDGLPGSMNFGQFVQLDVVSVKVH